MLKILVSRKNSRRQTIGQSANSWTFIRILYLRLKRCYCNFNYSTKTQSPSWNDWGSRFSNHNPCNCALSSLTNNEYLENWPLLKHIRLQWFKIMLHFIQPHKIINLTRIQIFRKSLNSTINFLLFFLQTRRIQ